MIKILKRGDYTKKYRRFRLTCVHCRSEFLIDEFEFEDDAVHDDNCRIIVHYKCPVCNNESVTWFGSRADNVTYIIETYKEGSLVDKEIKRGPEV